MAESGGSAGTKPARRERIRRFLLDLTSLEINTLVTESITGEPMPEPHEAVARLRAQYAAELAARGGAEHGGPESAAAGQASAPAADDEHLVHVRARSEHLGRLAAKLGIDRGAAEAASPQPASAGDPTARLAPEEMIALRKIWELGTEKIALQTVVQAGGDLITRIHPDYVSGPQTVLLDLQHTGIRTAVGIWETLVNTVVQILEKILDR